MRPIFFVIIILSFLLPMNMCYAAGNNILSVKATVVSKSNCKFNSATSSINFGNLDPSTPNDKTVDTSVTFRCQGGASEATFYISHDSGLYETGPDALRMRHTTQVNEYLPYTLTLNPQSGTVPKGTNQTLTITGKVKGTDFQNAYAGSYADTVVISIEP